MNKLDQRKCPNNLNVHLNHQKDIRVFKPLLNRQDIAEPKKTIQPKPLPGIDADFSVESS